MTAAYNMSVHEVNLAVIKQTLNKQLCDEVLCGYEREPILRITALSKTQCSTVNIMDLSA